MILEAIVTTRNQDSSVNVAPMGPNVADGLESFDLKPFNSSTTFTNLKRERCGCLNISDDVGLFAAAITHQPIPGPFEPASAVDSVFLKSAARVYEFDVVWIDESQPRTVIKCETKRVHRIRDLFGFNRAKHAVIEAAILASRLDFLPAEHVAEQFQSLATIVQKTGSQQELDAFESLEQFRQATVS